MTVGLVEKDTFSCLCGMKGGGEGGVGVGVKGSLYLK